MILFILGFVITFAIMFMFILWSMFHVSGEHSDHEDNMVSKKTLRRYEDKE